MSNARWSTFIAALALIIGWGVFRSPPPPDIHHEDDARPTADAAKLEPVPILERTMASKEAPKAERPHRFEYQSELDKFQSLKKKVFLSEDEKGERLRIIRDSRLLRALGLRLTETTINPEVSASQDAAIDLLLEALKEGDSQVASDVLRSVIEDPKVEDGGLPQAVREHLAGIKAEVLYHWAALMPNEASRVQNSLPGPVSRKIWDRVANRHASNVAESLAEAAKAATKAD